MPNTRSGPVLIAMPTGRDASLAAAALQQVGLQTHLCHNLSELAQAISPDVAAVLLAEEALAGQDIEGLLDTLQNQSPWSDLPILFLTRPESYPSPETRANTRRLQTVTSITLLDRPLRKATLISAVHSALRARQRQWQVCDLLEQRKTNEEALLHAKQQAEAANRAKDDFLAALSHELRTPLTPALMTVATLCQEERLPLDIRKELAVVERHISLEARLIDDLLDLTRIRNGKLPLRLELCDAHALLIDATEIVRDDAQSKNLRLELLLQAPRSGLNADATRLQQVVWNLLKNAVKFTPVGGQITLKTYNQDQALVIAVTDTGIGFAAQDADKIFHPFQQAHEAHTFGGLGLGLAISRALVEMHGGYIEARSNGLNQGAVFEVVLPDAREAPQQIREPLSASSPHTKSGPSLSVLLVEDHPATLATLQRLLRRAGHTVTTATSVAEASEKAAEDRPLDALITDLGLPDGTGIDVMEQVRQHHPQLPGIVLSGYGMEEDHARSIAAGFSAHLIKPIVFQQLQSALQTLGSAASRKDVGKI